MSTLAINDPVHVERESQKLEGVIAYVGPVQFSDGDDWVGVRLTGAFIGLGKNDGSVKGERYFHCGPNNGVFVRMSHVSARTLTRLEELRLKRELAKANADIATATANAATTSSENKPLSSPMKSIDPVKSAISSPALPPSAGKSTTLAPTTTTKKSKLEEMRERRAALENARLVHSQSLSAAPSQNNSPGIVEAGEVGDDLKDGLISSLRDQLKDMQQQWAGTVEKLKIKEQENASLQESLSKSEQEVHDANTKAEEAQSVAAPTMTLELTDIALDEALAQAKDELHQVKQECKSQLDNLEQLKMELYSTKIDLEKEREGRAADVEDLTKTKSELSALQHEVQAMSDQVNVRSTSDAMHYKERAKLQAELCAMKRTIEALETEKVQMESNIEDLTLDKEQLQEENETLQDRLDEIKIDAETAQMEVEELRTELEDAKRQKESPVGELQMEVSSEADDALHSLSVQNGRLREALIRLREQSLIEKVAMSKELRAAEKAALEGNALFTEVETLRSSTKVLHDQISDLKDMVEEGSAFESMVEDLSDRVMALEDENVALQSTIREMEEASDIAGEMEEVQAEELKALMRDVDGRDAIIRNLEEAIKMQRRREEDFQRTVGNYRHTVATLKQEKEQLLALQRGGEGEKSDLLAASQKALSRAAHLVSDAANSRKRDAEAAFVQIECRIQHHLAERLESFLPQSIAGPELAAVRGELLVSSIVDKASKALDDMGSIFSQTIRAGISETFSESGENGDALSFALSEDAVQGIDSMLHQSEYAIHTINLSSDLIRLLAAGQWPDVLTTEESTELGAILGHSLLEIETAMSSMLKGLKEEGVLSPHRSNLGAFQQNIQTTIQVLNSSIERDGNALISPVWNPPALELFKALTTAKFLCLGAGSVVASAVCPKDSTVSSGSSVLASTNSKLALKAVMVKLDQISGEACKIGPRLARLDVMNERTVKEIEQVADEWKTASLQLMTTIKALFAPRSEFQLSAVVVCEAASDVVIKAMNQLSSSLRAADLNAEDDALFHPFAAEAKDPWNGITSLAQTVRAIDGDRDDINFIVRAQTIEQRVVEAIENEPKLDIATSKIASLEKSLSLRSKEVAMQNAKLSELEKVLTKSSVPTPQVAQKSIDISSVAEINGLQEENRVLTEAMDVLQQQVDEYENEIRAIKDPKSPKPRGITASRKAAGLFSTSRSARGFDDTSGVAETSQAAVAAIEAAFYRPALMSARREASSWKAMAMSSIISDLPPLNVPRVSFPFGESKEAEADGSPLAALEAARSGLRNAKAASTIVDLTKPSPRAQYFDTMSRVAFAEERLKQATAAADQWMSNFGGSSNSHEAGLLLGRVKLPGLPESATTISVSVNREDMNRLHMIMLQ